MYILDMIIDFHSPIYQRGIPFLAKLTNHFMKWMFNYVMRVPPNHPSQKPIVTWGSPFGGNPHCIPILAYMNPMIFP